MPSFNIEDYINSLPEDIESIDVSGKFLTYLPSLKRFHKLKKLDCSDNQLTNLPELNHSLEWLVCFNNKLTSLPKLNDNLERLNCDENKLTSLPQLNKNLRFLYCYGNQLTSLPQLNNSLKILHCSNNQLTRLPKLNYSLQYLDCNHNKLICLPELNNNLQYLYCLINLLPSFIPTTNGILIQGTRNRINNAFQLYRFKLLFWSLKYKQKFRDWLWIRVRLPKIEKMYHPSKLNELLYSSDMNDEELDNVIGTW